MGRKRERDSVGVATHLGGSAPGVGDGKPLGVTARAKHSVWRPVLTRALSIGVGMVGLATIGLVAGAPRAERVELMSMMPGLDGTWLAAAPTESGSSPKAASGSVEPLPSRTAPSEPLERPAPDDVQSDAKEPEREAPPQGVTKDGKVILNTASVDELTRLPGIGKKRAEQIVALRERLKRFRKVTDLLRVKGIGPKSLRKMMPHMVLDPESQEEAKD